MEKCIDGEAPNQPPNQPPKSTLHATLHRRACELIEEAYAIEPRLSTLLSAANLRLKLGDFAMAAAAYRKVNQTQIPLM